MTRRLPLVLAGLSAVALLVFAVLAFERAPYPFELEWQEGGILQHVHRVLEGRPIYVRPSLEYAAFPYTPLFYYAGALSSRVLGEGFLALRIVSTVSTCACFVLLHLLAARRARDPLAGILAAGLFAASYGACGAWFDVARVDSLSLALTLAALLVLETRRGLVAAVAGALIFFLAFFAKQNALVPALLVACALLVRDRREALAFAGALAVLVVGSTLVLDASSEGWYRWHVFGLLGGHRFVPSAILDHARATLLSPIPTLVLVVLAARSEAGRERSTIPFAVGGLWLSAWIGLAHVGGYVNTLIPAFAGAALLFGPALASVLRSGGGLAVAGALAGVLQFALFVYDPRPLVPTEADARAGAEIVERLRAVEGRVWIPDHGYLALRAGKGDAAHGMAVIDLLQGSDREVAQRFVDELSSALSGKRFAAVVLDRRWDTDLAPLAENYRAGEWSYPDERTFLPVSGDPHRPRYAYAPR